MSELLFGRFEVLDHLGTGSAAEVYKVKNVKTGDLQALKVLSAEDDETAERTYREGQIQKQLKHPNIARVAEVFLNRRDVGLLMEFVDGPSLDEMLAQGNPFGLEEALSFFAQLLSAMESAHKAGIVHRDLKPSNILVYESAQGVITAKIIDFGQARAEQAMGNSRMTVMGAQLGTAGYAAPEQLIDAREAGVPADVFSLGAILYELATGVPAFYRKDNNIAAYRATLEGKYTPVDERLPECPMHLASAITRALHRDAPERFQSCSEFALALYGEELDERPPATPLKIRSAHIASKSNLGQRVEVLDTPQGTRSMIPASPPRADKAGAEKAAAKAAKEPGVGSISMSLQAWLMLAMAIVLGAGLAVFAAAAFVLLRLT